MKKQKVILTLIDGIGEHLIDMKDTINEVVNAEDIEKGIKERLLFKLLYINLAIKNIQYYL